MQPRGRRYLLRFKQTWETKGPLTLASLSYYNANP